MAPQSLRASSFVDHGDRSSFAWSASRGRRSSHRGRIRWHLRVQHTSYLADLDDWQDDWRSFSTALVVSGAVLTATGIGLTTWGIVRMRKHRQSSTGGRASLAPSLGPGQAGATLNVAF